MTGEISHLLFALGVFVGGHFILSHPLRRPFVVLLSENGFRAFYSIIALAGLIWTIFAYRAAPFIDVWPQVAALRWPVNIVMWAACILLTGSFMTDNPYLKTIVGKTAQEIKPTGVFVITRHPFMWAVGLWALSHFVMNGDLATLTLTFGVGFLALFGAYLQDRKLAERFGIAWTDFNQRTAFIPFSTIIKGQHSLKTIGVLPVLAGSALYLVLMVAHDWLGGVSAAPH